MANEHAKAQLADLIEMVKDGMTAMARAQEERARLTATAHAAGRRVTITVNADCIVIKTEFSDDVDDLTYAEIANAVTSATQDAAAQVQQKAAQIMTNLEQEQAQIPTLSEFFPEMPDVKAMLPTPPKVSTAPPDASKRRMDYTPDDGPRYTNVEEYEHDPQARQRSSISAPEW
ncbi:YbaB/EbfC family nucleoid-associated protein [Nocardia yamanashiensis]|uniref:YbaB/EbfC family nucleoid-associated protein n=1 Tax=Nocardia yamanashiensis TaxID=209247 RepID=UPI001E6497A8|nr:YbaB/EbfC family nucleoid-associated protein [Nocardia yamanashiensis]UGT39676.1 YbaB/EbfC family nucleoid-associated protein [Nocardia yamanashiensis]